MYPLPSSPPFVFPCRTVSLTGSASALPNNPAKPSPASSNLSLSAPLDIPAATSSTAPSSLLPSPSSETLLPALSLRFLDTAYAGWQNSWQSVFRHEVSVARKVATFLKLIAGHPLEKSPHLRHFLQASHFLPLLHLSGLTALTIWLGAVPSELFIADGVGRRNIATGHCEFGGSVGLSVHCGWHSHIRNMCSHILSSFRYAEGESQDTH